MKNCSCNEPKLKEYSLQSEKDIPIFLDHFLNCLFYGCNAYTAENIDDIFYGYSKYRTIFRFIPNENGQNYIYFNIDIFEEISDIFVVDLKMDTEDLVITIIKKIYAILDKEEEMKDTSFRAYKDYKIIRFFKSLFLHRADKIDYVYYILKYTLCISIAILLTLLIANLFNIQW